MRTVRWHQPLQRRVSDVEHRASRLQAATPAFDCAESVHPFRIERLPSALIAFSAVCLAVRAAIVLWRWSGYEIAQFFFADDAFYYFKIAQNIAAGRGSTFDGIALTNGYHPLWELVCVALHALPGVAELQTVRAVYCLQMGLLVAAVWLLYRGLRPLQPLAAATSGALIGFGTISAHVLLNGMESTLAFTFLTSWVYLAGVREQRFTDLRSGRYALLIFVLLLGLSLARLEAGLFAVLFLLGALYAGFTASDARSRRLQLRNTLFLGSGLAGCGLAYAAFNLSLVGVPVPISGLAKSLWTVPSEQMLRLWDAELSWFVAPLRLHAALEGRALTILLACMLLAGLVAFVREVVARRLIGFCLLVIGCFCLVVNNLLFTKQSFYWYGWPNVMLGGLGTFGLLTTALHGYERSSLRSQLASLATAALVIMYGVATDYRYATRTYDRLYDWGRPLILMDSSLRFITEEIPRDEVLAGDSVGLLAYLSGRDIINLEGLVGDQAYYHALKTKRTDELLRARHVKWLMIDDPTKYVQASSVAQTWSIVEHYRLGLAPKDGDRHMHRLRYAALLEPSR
jgi:hypothetical protein